MCSSSIQSWRFERLINIGFSFFFCRRLFLQDPFFFFLRISKMKFVSDSSDFKSLRDSEQVEEESFRFFNSFWGPRRFSMILKRLWSRSPTILNPFWGFFSGKFRRKDRPLVSRRSSAVHLETLSRVLGANSTSPCYWIRQTVSKRSVRKYTGRFDQVNACIMPSYSNV